LNASCIGVLRAPAVLRGIRTVSTVKARTFGPGPARKSRRRRYIR
jgi:hypothetical protein